MKRIFFFATPRDIAPVLKTFEANAPLKFVGTENLTTPDREIYLDSTEIPNPGVSTHESGHGSTNYMVSHRDTKNNVHTLVGQNGEKRWVLDNCDNEEAVNLTMAGKWKDMLLPGIMDTLHETPVAQQLMKWFLAALKAEGFTKVDMYWMGKEALEMLKAGKRLSTTAEQSPPEFDLKLPNDLKAK
ncbi:MAG: hypothetical protein HC850_09420 [Rhodomicrobium sp.]|nr:hypothetical protein [Rhodomicrobium sp.]